MLLLQSRDACEHGSADLLFTDTVPNVFWCITTSIKGK